MVVSKRDRYCSGQLPALLELDSPGTVTGPKPKPARFDAQQFADCPGMEDMSSSDDSSEVSETEARNHEFNYTMRLSMEDMLGAAPLSADFAISQSEIDQMVNKILSDQPGTLPTNQSERTRPTTNEHENIDDRHGEADVLQIAPNGRDPDNLIIDLIVLLFGLTVALPIAAVEALRGIPNSFMNVIRSLWRD